MAREDPPSALERGQPLGRYVVVERIGRGAMGEVYRAHDTALDRMVAIKVLTCTLDDDPLRESITVREGQMLARVRHPNVVAVYDVGVSEGWPFIALELVEGRPLSEWAEAHQPSARDLELMLHRLAGGLQAIHDAGLIHRDIKPGNILVEEDGVPRLADLGVAKLVGDMSRDPEVAAATLVGTYGFMAPEISSGRGAKPASDVFSLCTAIAKVLPEGKTDATSRRLRDVLERGMSKDADARPSATELEALTRPRPRAQRQAVVGLLGVLVGAGGIYAWYGQPHPRCKSTSQELDDVWDEAKQDEVRAAILATGHPIAEETAMQVERALGGYAADWLAQYDRVCESASAVREDESTERAFHCLGRRRIELEALADALASIDAGSVLLAAQAVSSLSSPTECLEAGSEHDVDPETAGAVLARLSSSHSKAELGRFDEARAIADEVLTSDMELTTALAGEAHYHRARADLSLGRAPSALRGFRETYYAGVEADEPRLMMWAAKSLTNTFVMLEQADDARHWLRLAKILAKQIDSPTWDLTYRDGLIADLEGDLNRAVELFGKALEQQGGQAKNQTHVMRNDLANALLRQHRTEAAIEQLELAHASCVEFLGEHHPHAIAIMGGLGMAYRDLGRLDRAAEILSSTLRRFEASVGPSHPFVAISSGNLGVILAEMGRFDDAIASFREAAEIWRELRGPSSPDFVLNELLIAEALTTAGRSAEALEQLTSLQRDLAESFDGRARLRLHLENQLANVLLARGDAVGALQHATSAAALAEQVEREESSVIFEVIARRAEALVALGNFEEADAILGPLLETFDDASAIPPYVAWAYFTEARALASTGNTERALQSAEKAEAALAEGDPARLETIRAWVAEHQS